MGAGALPLFPDARPFLMGFIGALPFLVDFICLDRRLLLTSRSGPTIFLLAVSICGYSPLSKQIDICIWFLKWTTADNDANSRKKQEKEGGWGSKSSQKMSETARLFKVLKYATTCNSLYNEVKRECKKKKKIFTMFSHCSK